VNLNRRDKAIIPLLFSWVLYIPAQLVVKFG
jgi:hypothetical protein